MKPKWQSHPDAWKLIVAARKVVLQFRSPCIQQYMTKKELETYDELFKVVMEVAQFCKKEN